jgi:hypothetical protein
MGQLQKATLQEITSDEQRKPVGEPMEVQFNPTTLQLTITNQIEGGDSRGRPGRQYVGSSSTVLACDLVFDSADEGTTDSPVSVRSKTALVERFLLPKPDPKGGKETVPKLQFQWGELIHEGIVDSLTLDFDHFAANGTPLRAKVKLSIKEQNAKYQFLQSGPGANKGAAPLPGSLGLSAGLSAGLSLGAGLSIGGGLSLGGSLGLSAGVSAQAALALGGETAVEFAARMGLDPASWRGLEADLGGSLTLEAGAEVGFSPEMSGNAGLGSRPGALAADAGSPAAAYGLGSAAGGAAGAAGGGKAAALLEQRSAGVALAAAGGVLPALEAVATLEAKSAAGAARAAFGAPAGADTAVAGRPAKPVQSHRPLRASGPRTAAQQAMAAPAPSLPEADPRETTFGLGVPLAPRRGGRLGAAAAAIAGDALPTVPPWKQLPRRAFEPEAGDGHGDCGCGCGGSGSGSSGGCGCGGPK